MQGPKKSKNNSRKQSFQNSTLQAALKQSSRDRSSSSNSKSRKSPYRLPDQINKESVLSLTQIARGERTVKPGNRPRNLLSVNYSLSRNGPQKVKPLSQGSKKLTRTSRRPRLEPIEGSSSFISPEEIIKMNNSSVFYSGRKVKNAQDHYRGVKGISKRSFSCSFPHKKVLRSIKTENEKFEKLNKRELLSFLNSSTPSNSGRPQHVPLLRNDRAYSRFCHPSKQRKSKNGVNVITYQPNILMESLSAYRSKDRHPKMPEPSIRPVTYIKNKVKMLRRSMRSKHEMRHIEEFMRDNQRFQQASLYMERLKNAQKKIARTRLTGLNPIKKQFKSSFKDEDEPWEEQNGSSLRKIGRFDPSTVPKKVNCLISDLGKKGKAKGLLSSPSKNELAAELIRKGEFGDSKF